MSGWSSLPLPLPSDILKWRSDFCTFDLTIRMCKKSYCNTSVGLRHFLKLGGEKMWLIAFLWKTIQILPIIKYIFRRFLGILTWLLSLPLLQFFFFGSSFSEMTRCLETNGSYWSLFISSKFKTDLIRKFSRFLPFSVWNSKIFWKTLNWLVLLVNYSI